MDASAMDEIRLPGYACTWITYLPPLPKDSLSDYATRLLPQVRHARPVIIGISFGGMIAVEISRLIHTQQLILISTLHRRAGLPMVYRFVLQALTPCMPWLRSARWSRPMLFWFFSAHTERQRSVLERSLALIDNDLMCWALKCISAWRNTYMPPYTFTIHGTHDRVFPCSGADFCIQKGGHLMLLDRTSELLPLLIRILDMCSHPMGLPADERVT